MFQFYAYDGRLFGKVIMISDDEKFQFTIEGPPSNKKHLKMVVIGRTGSGKTTLINSLVNHFYDIKYTDERVIAISQEQTLRDPETEEEVRIKLESNIEEFKFKQSDVGGNQTKSQTTKPNIYDMENHQFKLTIVDTPGLGDTGGIESDKKHCRHISAAVAALTDFNAIVLVHKANDCRKDVLLCYLITEFKGMLPKGCEENFVICFTSSVNKRKIDAIPVIKDMGLPILKDHYFSFENDSLTPPSELLRVCGITQPYKSFQESQNAKKYLKFPQMYWQENGEEFKSMLARIANLAPLPGKSFIEISNKKEILIKMVQRHGDNFVVLQDEQRRQQVQLKRAENLKRQIAQNKDYISSGIRQVSKTRKVKAKKFEDIQLPAGTKITQCMTCKYLCHNPCYLDQIYSQGHINLKGCTAFQDNSTCRQSSCKHEYDVHTHTTVIRKETEVEEDEQYFESESYSVTDTSKQTAYQMAQKDLQMVEDSISKLSRKTQQLDSEVQVVYKTIAFLHKQLEESTICAHNEYFLEYIEYRKKVTATNPNFTREEIQQELAQLQKAENQYLMVKKFVKEMKTFPLSRTDAILIEREYKSVEEEQQKMISTFQGDRRCYSYKQTYQQQRTFTKGYRIMMHDSRVS